MAKIDNLEVSPTAVAKMGAFKLAQSLVDPLVEKHGVETYSTGAAFQVSYKTTAVDQHLEHILRVADWLLG